MRRLVIVSALLAMTLISCSSADSSTTESITSTSTTVTVTVASTTTLESQPETSQSTNTAVPVPVVAISVDPGTGAEFEGAVADVSELSCALQDDRWMVGGKLTNATGTAVDYRIYVSFLDSAGGARGLLEVDSTDVAAGMTVEWQGELPLPESDLTCVLRVERTAVG